MRRIKLSQRKIAMIDDGDYAEVKKHKWCVSHPERRQCYAVSRINGRVLPMHRFILGIIDAPTMSDHRDGNGLNNRRSNLRLCNNQLNSMNQRTQTRIKSSRYKGVTWDKERNLWMSKTKLNQKTIFLGRFKTQREAAKVYNFKASELFGEFARLNNV